ncbi:hypothetical protein CCACVL1_21797 [Corchorus capsularis]|uniref:Pentacotripeptide-repeat region of PRORP domain-containing protein n=1 Tax=Corchorus capsularis TaxID=210143 RepID=A0A1R3H280_COCAP|nr:hypothetical protein CCACVL1_21797 [Corchorus capsularis]
MKATLAASRHSKPLLYRHLKPQPPSYIFKCHLCTESNAELPSPATLPEDDESKITQAVQLLLETPHQEWSSSQPLQSILFSSSPPSPLFFLRITRCLPSSSEALNFIEHLRQNSPSQNTQFLSYPFQALLEHAGRAANTTTSLSELYEASKEWEIPLTINAGVLLIRYFGRLGMVDKSLLVFSELDPSLKNTHVRNVLIDVLLRDGGVDDALNVLDGMLQPSSEVPPNELTGDIVFYALVKEGRKGRELSDKELIKLVSRFAEHSVFPNPKWLTQLFTKLCRSRQIDQAWNLLHEMLRVRAPLETATFNAVLTVLGRREDVDGMNRLLAEMKENDIRPDAVTFGILMNHLCKVGRVDDAMEILNKMSEETGYDGVSIEADIVMYNTVINGLCKVGRQEEGLQLMERMRSMKGVKPKAATYNCLIGGFCRVGEIERGMELFEQMKEEKVSPNVITLNTLVDESLCKNNSIDLALSLMDDMKAKGVKPDTITYNAIFKGLKEKNLLKRALKLMDSMVEHACKPNYVTIEVLTEWLCAVGESEKLKSFLQGYEVSTSDSEAGIYHGNINTKAVDHIEVCLFKVKVQLNTRIELKKTRTLTRKVNKDGHDLVILINQ